MIIGPPDPPLTLKLRFENLCLRFSYSIQSGKHLDLRERVFFQIWKTDSEMNYKKNIVGLFQ